MTVSLREASKFWLKLGFISFGGPAGQIALMHWDTYLAQVTAGRHLLRRSVKVWPACICWSIAYPVTDWLRTKVGLDALACLNTDYTNCGFKTDVQEDMITRGRPAWS